MPPKCCLRFVPQGLLFKGLYSSLLANMLSKQNLNLATSKQTQIIRCSVHKLMYIMKLIVLVQNVTKTVQPLTRVYRMTINRINCTLLQIHNLWINFHERFCEMISIVRRNFITIKKCILI